MPSACNVACSEQLTNATARDRLITPAHFGIDRHCKAEFSSKLLQCVAVAFSTMPKMEACAFMHFLRVKPFDDHLLHELSRRDDSQLLREWENESGIDAGLF